MNNEIFNNLVKLITEELNKEHEPTTVTVDGFQFQEPFNKFAVSLNDLNYDTKAYDEAGHNKIMEMVIKKLSDKFPDGYVVFTYEVPQGVIDLRHYLYRHLPRVGKPEHFNIVARLQ
jgi:hypothetical protein